MKTTLSSLSAFSGALKLGSSLSQGSALSLAPSHSCLFASHKFYLSILFSFYQACNMYMKYELHTKNIEAHIRLCVWNAAKQ